MKQPQDWNQPCPKTACSHDGQKNQGNISCIATYMTQSGKRRIFTCKTCGEQFSETRDTVSFDLRTPEEKVMMALKMILVRVSLTDISSVLSVKTETVLEWLERAARKAEEINAGLLQELPVTEVQLNEMWSVVKRKVSELAQGELRKSSRGGRWSSVGVDWVCTGISIDHRHRCWSSNRRNGVGVDASDCQTCEGHSGVFQ